MPCLTLPSGQCNVGCKVSVIINEISRKQIKHDIDQLKPRSIEHKNRRELMKVQTLV